MNDDVLHLDIEEQAKRYRCSHNNLKGTCNVYTCVHYKPVAEDKAVDSRPPKPPLRTTDPVVCPHGWAWAGEGLCPDEPACRARQHEVRRKIEAVMIPADPTDDSSRHVFESGAVRSKDADDVAFHLMCPAALRRYARRLEIGAFKYGDSNYCKGMPTGGSILNHMFYHLTAYMAADTSDDHLGAIIWGAASMIHFEEGCRHAERIEANKVIDARYFNEVGRELADYLDACKTAERRPDWAVKMPEFIHRILHPGPQQPAEPTETVWGESPLKKYNPLSHVLRCPWCHSSSASVHSLCKQCREIGCIHCLSNDLSDSGHGVHMLQPSACASIRDEKQKAAPMHP